MKTSYDDKDDVLNIQLSSGNYWKSVELDNGVVFDVNKEGAIMAIEVLKASKVFSGDAKKVLESV